MKCNMSGTGEDHSISQGNKMKMQSKDAMPGSELWTDGLICAFEFVQGHRKSVRPKSYSKIKCAHEMDGENVKKPIYGMTEASTQKVKGSDFSKTTSFIELGAHQIAPFDDNIDSQTPQSGSFCTMERFVGSHWVPIGWARISELIQTVKVDGAWASQQFDLMDDEDDLTVADLAAPYWEHPSGPVWWCHVAAGHPFIDAWLKNAQWLHPAIGIALRDESRLISDRMKHLLYEVPVRVAGGLLFELLGQSAGDPFVDEDDIPVVLRSWQAQHFLLTALHIKGSALSINVLGITEVQELLFAGGNNTPRTIYEVIAHLASRLARWDDRLFRKSIFGAADEIELKFMNRRNQEDMNLFSIILNQEIRRLSRQVIRVKWSLHAREEIVFELLQHLRGNAARSLLEGIRKSTREMIEEQEAARGRLFTIQDVMQSTVRAWLQVCVKKQVNIIGISK
uniref:Putative Magnesium transporter CorA-like family protein n=1 Tax=Davidia involucrata TaxID=16924 RepID=A0A5B6Z6C8_DAVIN